MQKPWTWLFLLLISGLAFYWPSFSFDFVNYDDPYVLVEKAYVRNFELESILTKPVSGLYHPLTTLTHAIDWQIADGNPTPFHITNFLLHLASSFLLYLICLRLFPKTIWTARVMSLIFLLHPLKVESVGWITERKDLLSIAFVFLSIWFYLKYRAEEGKKYLLYSVLSFVLGTLAKISIITYPGALLLLDIFQRRKLDREVLLEKIYFVLPSLPSLWLNIQAQLKFGVTLSADAKKAFEFPRQILFYIEKIFFPLDLRPLYLPEFMKMGLWTTMAALLLGTLLVLAQRWEKNEFSRRVLLGFGFFFCFLAPNMKFVRYGDENIVNDRYVYMAAVGFFIAFLPSVIEHTVQTTNQLQKRLIIAVGAGFFGFWLTQLPAQLMIWKDTYALWHHVLRLEPTSAKAAGNLAKFYVLDKKYDKAIDVLLDIKGLPQDAAILGYAYDQLGYKDKSRNVLENANKLYPTNPDVLNQLSLLRMRDGQLEEGLQMLKKAEDHLDDDSPEMLRSQIYMHQSMGLMAQNKNAEAEEKLRAALKLNENDEKIYYNLGLCLLKQNRLDEAEKEFTKSIDKNPKRAEAFHNLGLIAFQRGDLNGAISKLQLALSIRPDFVEAQRNLQLIQNQLETARARK